MNIVLTIFLMAKVLFISTGLGKGFLNITIKFRLVGFQSDIFSNRVAIIAVKTVFKQMISSKLFSVNDLHYSKKTKGYSWYKTIALIFFK